MDMEQIMQEVQRTLPPLPAVRFTVEIGEPGLFDSKIGGTPYFPRNMEYPCGREDEFAGQPLTFLAQLNFEKLPHIPDFPEKGILQFFIASDTMYGMSCDYGNGMAAQNNFRVIYHENLITDESQLLSAEEIPQSKETDEDYLPFRGAYRLTAHEAELMPPKPGDFRFDDAFVKAYNAHADEPISSFYDLYHVLEDDEMESLTGGDIEAVMGGYPVFSQEDPRTMECLADCDTLLFELDSVYDPENGFDILWGDMGTGTFFIPRENLKNRDFSRVLYNYDCC